MRKRFRDHKHQSSLTHTLRFVGAAALLTGGLALLFGTPALADGRDGRAPVLAKKAVYHGDGVPVQYASHRSHRHNNECRHRAPFWFVKRHFRHHKHAHRKYHRGHHGYAARHDDRGHHRYSPRHHDRGHHGYAPRHHDRGHDQRSYRGDRRVRDDDRRTGRRGDRRSRRH